MFIHLFNIRYILESKYNNIIYVQTDHNIRVASDSVTPWATTDTGWAEPTAYIVGIRFRLEWEFWYEPESVAWGRLPQERASAQSRVLCM